MTTDQAPRPAGTPAWADLTVPDLAVALAFYGPLLGWRFEVGGPDVGGYTQAFVDGHRVAGFSEAADGDPGARAAWCVYLATDDLATTTAAVTSAGGTVVVPPLPVLDLGSMALVADPAGAVFGLWQPAGLTGWDVVGEAGSVVWSEVMAHDQPRVLEFYRRVFGYTVEDLSAPGFTYAIVHLGETPVAGVGGYGPRAGAEAPAAWTLYFGVQDTDDAAARLIRLGGRVVSPPTDTAFGRMAIATGPFGEVFALMGPATDAWTDT